MIHVIDTHALTRYIEDYRRLGAAGRAIFDDPDSVLVVPTIALAEARFMIFKNKVGLVWDDPDSPNLGRTQPRSREFRDARRHHRRHWPDVS